MAEELKEQVDDIEGVICYTWDELKNIKEVLRELKSLLKGNDFDGSMWNKTIFNRKLDTIFKKLNGGNSEDIFYCKVCKVIHRFGCGKE